MDNTQGAKSATVRTIAIGIAAGAAVAALTFFGQAVHGRVKSNGNELIYVGNLVELGTERKVADKLNFQCVASGDIVVPDEIDGAVVDSVDVYGSSVTSVEFPHSATDISISDSPMLESITIPDSVTKIYIKNCAMLKSITILSKGVTTVETISDCPMLESITFSDGVRTIQSIENCPMLKSITIPDNVTSFGGIKNCNALNEINISDGASSSHFTFTNCPSLNSIKLPSSVPTGDYYFDFTNCSSLTEIEIPDGVSVLSFRGDPFYGCSNLRRISISASTEISEEARNYGWLDKVYRREN